ncbi:MAG: hypothetical protein H7X93_02340 [Sphingomonadaceae bacterium]|nr:hypothetical protein [Sphingomonadaceae bacterium]
MKLPPVREGTKLLVKGKRVPFTYWPTYQGPTREGLQWTVFASDPWFLIETSLLTLPTAAREQASAFLIQARDFFRAATDSHISAAKPLLLYYSFLNLAKCYVVKQQNAPITGRVEHGLSEKLPTTPGAIHGDVHVLRNKDTVSAFAMFSRAIGASLPVANAANQVASLRSQDFLAQILVGHRLWCRADNNRKERFISLRTLRYRYNYDDQEVWIAADVFKDDLTRFGYTQQEVANAFGSSIPFRNVASELEVDKRAVVKYEMINVVNYPNRPSECLADLSIALKSRLWRSVTMDHPFRKYYVYLPTSAQILLHQLQSLYIATYYFGSITRYKPVAFSEILRSPIGPFVNEFFTNQPAQFLYLMASEFVEQEITRAAIA